VALYEILKTPGRDRVYPVKEDDTPLRNQDEAKVVLARLRAEARAAEEPCDFIIRRLNEPGSPASNGSQATGTSIRLTEANRSMVARFCGRIMMETGEPVSMGDAVAKLVTIAEKATTLGIIGFDGTLDEDALITLAKQLNRERKAAAANA
jgi:hypothetical protein